MKATSAFSATTPAAADTTPAPPTPAPPTPADPVGKPFGAAPEEAVKGLNSFGFDRARLRSLQLADPYSGPLLIGLEVLASLDPSQQTRDHLYEALKRKFGKGKTDPTTTAPGKLAQRCLNEAGSWLLHDGLLF